MREVSGGATVARQATGDVLAVAADLHARHHFTHAAAVDGSMTEEPLQRGVRRTVAYGVWEGPSAPADAAWRSVATAEGLWGASLAPDCEVADAELAAIHAYLRAIVQREMDPSSARVLIMSDCLGALDAVESAWRAGDARGLRVRDRGAMRESICVLRSQLGRVVTMYVPAHSGNSMNAYADAAAKAHVSAPADDMREMLARVTSRPVSRIRPIGRCFRTSK